MDAAPLSNTTAVAAGARATPLIMHVESTNIAHPMQGRSGYLELQKPGGLSHCKEECETIAKVWVD